MRYAPKVIKDEDKPQQPCSSAECVNAAASIGAAMDPTADPCTDFWQVRLWSMMNDGAEMLMIWPMMARG